MVRSSGWLTEIVLMGALLVSNRFLHFVSSESYSDEIKLVDAILD